MEGNNEIPYPLVFCVQALKRSIKPGPIIYKNAKPEFVELLKNLIKKAKG